MSLVQKLQSSQQKDDNSPRRPSMAVKTLAVPTGGGGAAGGGAGRRTSSVSLAGPRTSSVSSGSQPNGPSFIGLLASQRLARRFASRFHSRRRWGSRLSAAVPVQKEPSYRMEPHHKFNASKVEDMLKTILEDRMSKSRYSPKICSNMCKILGDEIKERVKQMNFDRYKIVSNVIIGQKKDQAIIACSRCAWDDKLDNYASYTFQNEHVFVTATVFGIYTE